MVSATTTVGRRTMLRRLYATYAEDDAFAVLRAGARAVVHGDGSTAPRLMFVGEAPGRHEDKAGKPFIGASGRFLDEMLCSVNLNREEVFITNAVKYRPVAPGTNRNRPPTDREVFASIWYLRKEHAILGSPPMVLLGKHARHAAARLDQRSLRLGAPELHMKLGEWTTTLGVPMLPLYHPAYAIYQQANRPLLLDMFKAVLTPPTLHP